MVRDEPIFLPIWLHYYERFVPRSNLFILFDGLEAPIPDAVAGCQTLRVPLLEVGPGWDTARWNMLTAWTHMLLERFDVVVINDVDELIVLDPDFGTDLPAALAEARDVGVISPFAIELVHRRDLEPAALNPAQPILQQRRFGRINVSYCKPCILARQVRLSLGGHNSTFPTLHLSRKLFLFHLRLMDYHVLLSRQAQRRALVSDKTGAIVEGVAGHGWRRGGDEVDDYLKTFELRGPPREADDWRFDWQRRRVEQSWAYDPVNDYWRHATLHNRQTYVIPDRFRAVF